MRHVRALLVLFVVSTSLASGASTVNPALMRGADPCPRC